MLRVRNALALIDTGGQARVLRLSTVSGMPLAAVAAGGRHTCALRVDIVQNAYAVDCGDINDFRQADGWLLRAGQIRTALGC